MACIEHYVKDAENIFAEIEQRHRHAQNNIYLEYKAARTIQRWFRGYITRKYIKHLNASATTIQRLWRGFTDRKYYSLLLRDAVHKMYLEHYNLMATKIQKVWRGHYVRKHIFSYYKLKAYIWEILEKNRMFLENAKKYEHYTDAMQQKHQERECQEWLRYLSFRVHHLIRTHQIEGIYSIHGSFQYSAIEQHLKDARFQEYMDKKHAKQREKLLETSQQNYIFQGRMRECEDVWYHRNDPGKYSLATGEFGEDAKEYREQRKIEESLARIQDKPMHFGPVKHHDENIKLGFKHYKCPTLHRTVKEAT